MGSMPFRYKVQKTPKVPSIQDKAKGRGSTNGNIIRKKSQVSVLTLATGCLAGSVRGACNS